MFFNALQTHRQRDETTPTGMCTSTSYTTCSVWVFLQESRYTDANKTLDRKLIQFETQFHQSRNELKDLKSHLSRTEEALEHSRRQLQREQTQTKKLIDVSGARISAKN